MKNTPRRLLLLTGPGHSPKPAHSKHFSVDLAEMLKRKLSLGANILRVGGVDKIFRRVFKNGREGERLLKTSQCYLWTTSGPIGGLLFISTEKVAFCSHRPIKFSSPSGDLLRSHYKVSIPLPNLSSVVRREDASRRSDKYLQVVTTDDFDFWFLGFQGFNKTFKCLQQLIPQFSSDCFSG